jgi:PAS domain S-box-containing protein
MFKFGDRARSYIVAVAVTMLALLLMISLNPWLKIFETPFLLFFGAITVSAWYGGRGPGLVSTLLSALLINYVLFYPHYQISLDLINNMRMLLFVIQGYAISYFCGALRTAQKRALVSLQQLQESGESLRESEERYHQLAENLVETVFWISDPKKGKLIYVSPSYERIWGRSCEDLYANFMAWSEAIHPDDREQVRTIYLEQALSGGYDREYRIIRPDGSLRWIRDRGFPIPNESGEPYRVVGLAEDITKRKQMEMALQETVERLKMAQRAANAGWWNWDIANNRVIWSKEYRDLYGLDPSIVPSYENWLVSIVEEDRERVDREARQSLEEHTDLNIEFRVRHPIKGLRWLNAIGRTFYNAEGQPTRMTGITLDITDRKRSEEALRNSEAIASSRAKELEIFMETVPVGVWIARDPQCHEMIANRTAYEMIKIPLGGIATATPVDGTNPFKFKQRKNGQNFPPSELPMQRAARTGQEVEEEIELVFDDGEVRYLYGKAVPLKDDSGEVRGTIGAFLDVSDRKQIQEALRRREEELRLVTDRVPVLISFVDSQQRYRFNNRTYEEWFGHSAKEVYGKHIREVLGEPAYETIRSYIEQVLAGQQVTFESQVPYQDGGTRYVEATYVPQLDNRGNVEGFVALVSDISERKKAELQLLEQATKMRQTTELLAKRNQELDRFVYAVSHDLKAPLRAISNLSQWLEDDLKGQLSEENLQQMQLLRSRVHRMEALIDGLLVYARVGRTEVAEETVKLSELLAEILDSLAPPVTFNIIVKPPMPSFVAKRLLLNQVLTNLISNAIKHHHRPDGQIIISAAQKEDCYEFTIVDDGPGIAPEYHEKIFAIFQTLKADKTKDSTGIGLSIVRKIIETEGGKIFLESELGKGTTFRFTWPLQ